MKFYFNGDSWTKGAELENFEEERFSKLICDHYNAEETNLAYSGKSNEAMIREIYLDQPEPDLAFIQLTFPLRTEYYDVKSACWRRINVDPGYRSWSSKKSKDNVRETIPYSSIQDANKRQEYQDFWAFYYTEMVSTPFLEMKEKMQLEIVKAYFNSKNIPLILTTINCNSIHSDDFDLNLSKRPYPYAPKNHPTKEGHHMIKDDIINIIKSRGYCNV